MVDIDMCSSREEQLMRRIDILKRDNKIIIDCNKSVNTENNLLRKQIRQLKQDLEVERDIVDALDHVASLWEDLARKRIGKLYLVLQKFRGIGSVPPLPMYKVFSSEDLAREYLEKDGARRTDASTRHYISDNDMYLYEIVVCPMEY